MLLASQAIACFGFGIVCMLLPDPTYFGGIVLLLTGLLLQWIWMRTYYEITDQAIKVHCGPMWWTIPLSGIHRVEKTSSIWLLMGGPHLRFALSQTAVMVHYRTNSQHLWLGIFEPAVLISPAKRDEFLEELKTACPNLQASDDGNLEAAT